MLKTQPLSKLLTEDHIVVLSATTRKGAIEELLDVLVRTGDLPAGRRAHAARAILLRESQSPTGVGNGLAMPHAKLNGIPRFLSVIGVAPGGIDFGAKDGGARLIILLLSKPQTESAVQHLDLLRFIAERLGGDKDVAALTDGLKPAEVLEAIRSREPGG